MEIKLQNELPTDELPTGNGETANKVHEETKYFSDDVNLKNQRPVRQRNKPEYLKYFVCHNQYERGSDDYQAKLNKGKKTV